MEEQGGETYHFTIRITLITKITSVQHSELIPRGKKAE